MKFTPSPEPENLTSAARDTILPIRHELWNISQTKLKRLMKEPPKHLFHYTNSFGLKGIIESQAIWATDIRYLNDSNELAHASKIVLDAIEKRKKGNLGSLKTDLLFYLSMTFDYTSMYHIFTASFSEEKDSLDQWRGYSGGTGGFAIGFDFSDLYYQQDLMKVSYNEDDQHEMVDSLIDDMLRYYEDVASFTSDKVRKILSSEFCITFSRVMFTLMPQFKSKHWSSEKEWRIIVSVSKKEKNNKVKFRSGQIGLIPYLEFKPMRYQGTNYDLLPINTVVQGPHPHSNLGLESLNLFLQSTGYANVHTEASSVPLRF